MDSRDQRRILKRLDRLERQALHFRKDGAGNNTLAQRGVELVLAGESDSDAIHTGDAAAGVLSGTYPNPGFAADMATQSELDAHAADTTAIHGIVDTAQLPRLNVLAAWTAKHTISSQVGIAILLAQTAADYILANKLLAGDAQPAFRLRGDGWMGWGAGGGAAPDVYSQRIAAATLGITGHLYASGDVRSNRLSAADSILLSTAFAFPRMEFGAGGSTNTGVMEIYHFQDSFLLNKMLGLARASGRVHVADATGNGIGDKISLYGTTVANRSGIGMQPSRLVLYTMAGGGVAIRTTPASGQGSSGADKIVLYEDGRIAATGKVTGVGLDASDQKLTNVADGTASDDGAAFGQIIPKTLVDAKGDLIVGTADNAITRRPVGTNGQVLTADPAEPDGVKWTAGTPGPAGAAGPAGSIPYVCQGRLTLISGSAVTTSDVSAASTLYFTPHRGNKIDLYDGSAWASYAFTERSLGLSGLIANKNYDVFVYNNAGTLTLELAAWTNNSTRATALASQDGVLVKSGATTRRYLGTIRTTGTTTTEDSRSKRFVWNFSHRTARPLLRLEATYSWDYAGVAWRAANGVSLNVVACVIGVAEDAVSLDLDAAAENIVDSGFRSSISMDSMTAPHADGTIGYSWAPAATVAWTNHAGLTVIPPAGYHYFAWLEAVPGGAEMRFYGGNPGGEYGQSGLRGTVLA